MRNQNQSNLAVMMGAIFLAGAEALAQDQQQAASEEGEESRRRIVISIADRKLAVVEDGRVVRIYPTAVGADATPSPTGVFKIVNRVPNPTWYGPHRKIVRPGKANPLLATRSRQPRRPPGPNPAAATRSACRPLGSAIRRSPSAAGSRVGPAQAGTGAAAGARWF